MDNFVLNVFVNYLDQVCDKDWREIKVYFIFCQGIIVSLIY